MSRSKTSICTSSAGYACLAACIALAACHKPAPIAELTKADGVVERQAGSTTSAWQAAAIGSTYFLGDAARTSDSLATLLVGGAGGAQLLMQKHTVLRFGGAPGASKISVELGAVDLSGSGSYALDVGDVKLAQNGSVRITAQGDGRERVELTIGSAQVAARGQTYDLAIGTPVNMGSDAVPAPIDAAVAAPPPDAAAAPVPDDAAVASADGATIEVTGKRAELLAPGTTAWKPLPAGAGQLARGSEVRLGPGTTAKLTVGPTTLELATGGHARLTDDLALAIVAGNAQARATAAAVLGLPGGAVHLAGADQSPVEARVDSTPRDTKVAMLRGGAKLTGAPGTELGLARGESALLTRGGDIRVVEAIPSFFDFRVPAGETFTIHDPKPPASVQFQFNGKCADGGIIEVDRDTRFRTAKISSGHDFANVLVPAGSWAYRLRCTSNGGEGASVETGHFTALRDDGRRPLPKNPSVNDIDADGRNYRISYQSVIPPIAVHVKNPGAAHKLHLASAGKEQTFDFSAASFTVPGSSFHEGNYTYWVDRDGVRQEKISTLIIDFDQTAPQVYIESPVNGTPWNGDVDVRGAVLPGWAASIDQIAIPVDKQRRFAAQVGTPAGSALAIRLAHPQRGVHYYLRRQK